jgi:superfamily II DNA/RNA helicase
LLRYDTPDNIDSYVHRIGRTGRCGNKGTAISFLNDKNKPILKALVNLLDEEKVEIPPWLLQLQRKHVNPASCRSRPCSEYSEFSQFSEVSSNEDLGLIGYALKSYDNMVS